MAENWTFSIRHRSRLSCLQFSPICPRRQGNESPGLLPFVSLFFKFLFKFTYFKYSASTLLWGSRQHRRKRTETVAILSSRLSCGTPEPWLSSWTAAAISWCSRQHHLQPFLRWLIFWRHRHHHRVLTVNSISITNRKKKFNTQRRNCENKNLLILMLDGPNSNKDLIVHANDFNVSHQSHFVQYNGNFVNFIWVPRVILQKVSIDVFKAALWIHSRWRWCSRRLSAPCQVPICID